VGRSKNDIACFWPWRTSDEVFADGEGLDDLRAISLSRVVSDYETKQLDLAGAAIDWTCDKPNRLLLGRHPEAAVGAIRVAIREHLEPVAVIANSHHALAHGNFHLTSSAGFRTTIKGVA
jgi:hypothetical protein